MLALIVLTALTFLLRAWELNTIPPGLFGDEAQAGVDVQAWLRGESLHLFPHHLGGETLYGYLSIPFVALWDGTPLAIRLVSALMGALMIPALFLAARAVGPTGFVLGVDMTPEMLARARANAAKVGFANVEFRQGEIENLPVAANSIDVILSNCVINLAPDKAPVFAEMYRVLKPGGRFAISDMVTFGEVPEMIRTDMALWSGCIAGALDREIYLDMLAASGFRQIEVIKEQRYDASWLPKAHQQQDLARLQVERGDFGMASVTVTGWK